jgi:hypothetical protein
MDLIVGGGNYGARATRYFVRRGREFIVVDPDPECPAAAEIHDPGIGRLLVGGMETVCQVIHDHHPEQIFPTAPVHVAAGLVCEAGGFSESPDDIQGFRHCVPPELVLGIRGSSVYFSLNRDIPCIPDCPSPDTCPVTGEDRTIPLYDRLRQLLPGAFILESVQVAPGLGALRGNDISDLLRQVRGKKRVCIGTACRCHGVVTGLKAEFHSGGTA